MTQNGKSKNGKRIYNGKVFEVSGFTKSGDIKLSNGKVLDKDYGHFTYGYCTTSYSAQGRTCDDVYIAQSGLSYGGSNAQQFYVSASRARERIFIYTDDKVELRRVVSRKDDQISARELAGSRIRKRRKHNRRRFYQKMISKIYRYERTINKDQRDLQRTLEP